MFTDIIFTDIIAERYIKELVASCETFAGCVHEIDMVYSTLKNCFVNGKKLFCAGNGGSASDCEHICGELMKSFVLPRPLPEDLHSKLTSLCGSSSLADSLQMGLPCISLTSHPSLNTAFLNDVDGKMTFAQQLFVLGNEGDVLLGLSTSGNAENVCCAFQVAKAKGIRTILFTGQKTPPGICEKYSDVIFHAPEKETYKIQEYHLAVYHRICLMLEEYFYGKR